MTTYIVWAPIKRNALGLKQVVHLVTTDLELAKREAKKVRDYYTKLGWKGYADRVKLQAPKSAEVAQELALKLSKNWDYMNTTIRGNSYRSTSRGNVGFDVLKQWSQLLAA